MKTSHLIIFDETFVLTDRHKREIGSAGEVYLFPLSTDSHVLEKIESDLKQKEMNYAVLKSGFLINQSAENIREQYLELIAQLPGKIRHKGEDLKKYFAVDENASMWWLSLIGEKSTLKSSAFNALCKFDAIVQVLQQKDIRSICFGSSDGKLKSILTNYVHKKKINIICMTTKNWKSWKEQAMDFQGLFLIKHILLLARFVLSYGYRIHKIKKARPGRNIKKNSLLFLTYYPVFNMNVAESGVFQNNYCFPLQRALQEQGEDIQWLAISVSNDRLSLKDSLKYTQKFNENGNNIVYWEKFCTVKTQCKALLKIFQIGIRFLRLESKIAEAMSFENYNIYEAFRDDWFHSFIGKDGYYNLLFYYSWQAILQTYQPKRVFYYCEMQGWEKALILANQIQIKPAELIAYQHAAVSSMLLSYFNRPSEFTDGRYPLPQPDKLVCNGQKPYTDMLHSGWPKEKLMIAEAIRYEHLKKSMTEEVQMKKKVVLLALPISVRESGALMNVVKQALTPLENIEVWIKPHPFLLIEKVFQHVKFKREDVRFIIRQEPIEELLRQVKVMIGSQSGVSFEALAYGCEIVVVSTPEQINMSPLKNIQSDLIWQAQSIQDVRNIVLNILEKEIDVKQHLEEARKIIDSYFYLNRSSNQPERLLSLLGDAHASLV